MGDEGSEDCALFSKLGALPEKDRDSYFQTCIPVWRWAGNDNIAFTPLFPQAVVFNVDELSRMDLCNFTVAESELGKQSSRLQPAYAKREIASIFVLFSSWMQNILRSLLDRLPGDIILGGASSSHRDKSIDMSKIDSVNLYIGGRKSSTSMDVTFYPYSQNPSNGSYKLEVHFRILRPASSPVYKAIIGCRWPVVVLRPGDSWSCLSHHKPQLFMRYVPGNQPFQVRSVDIESRQINIDLPLEFLKLYKAAIDEWDQSVSSSRNGMIEFLSRETNLEQKFSGSVLFAKFNALQRFYYQRGVGTTSMTLPVNPDFNIGAVASSVHSVEQASSPRSPSRSAVAVNQVRDSPAHSSSSTADFNTPERLSASAARRPRTREASQRAWQTMGGNYPQTNHALPPRQAFSIFTPSPQRSPSHDTLLQTGNRRMTRANSASSLGSPRPDASDSHPIWRL